MRFEDADNSRGLQYELGISSEVLPAPLPRHEMAPQNGQPDAREVTTKEENIFGGNMVTLEGAPESQTEGVLHE